MLATKLKAIAHSENRKQYFSASTLNDMNEIEESVSQMNGTILIAMDSCNSSFLFPDSDSLLEVPEYSFVILTQTNKSENENAVEHSQLACKRLAKQIIARMLQDANRYKHGLQYIKGSSFKIEGIGPISDNFYGVELSFLFEKPENYTINSEMWEE